MTIKNPEQLTPHELNHFIKRGIIKVMIAEPLPMTIEEQPEFLLHKDKRGNTISLSAACRKYGLSLRTIQQWVAKGYIPVVGQDKNRVLIDEAYIAYCAEVRKSRPGQGRWLFNPDGTPYTPKTC